LSLGIAVEVVADAQVVAGDEEVALLKHSERWAVHAFSEEEPAD